MLKELRQYLHDLNNSKFLMGIAMLLLNVGSKYVEIGFSKTQEQALRNGLGRELLIFAMVFMGTHDIIISILMTAAFVVLSDYLLNERSNLCLVPSRLRQISRLVDKNKDNHISEKEEKDALEILRKAQLQKKEKTQSDFVSYMENFQI
jgi:hypothetical protein